MPNWAQVVAESDQLQAQMAQVPDEVFDALSVAAADLAGNLHAREVPLAATVGVVHGMVSNAVVNAYQLLEGDQGG